MSELVRFSVAMPDDLLASFDELVARRGLAENRSEAIRDLVRDALMDEDIQDPEQEVLGTLTIVFDHHANGLQSLLDDVQHNHFGEIVTSLHVHLDHHNCLEVIIMRGKNEVVRAIADAIIGIKGVRHGHLTVTAPGEAGTHSHEAHTHEHGHGHEPEHGTDAHAHGYSHAHEH